MTHSQILHHEERSGVKNMRSALVSSAVDYHYTVGKTYKDIGEMDRLFAIYLLHHKDHEVAQTGSLIFLRIDSAIWAGRIKG